MSIFLPLSYGTNDPLTRLHRDFSILFDDLHKHPQNFSNTTSLFNPPLDIEETEQEFVIKGDFAGIKEEDIEIDLHDNILTLKGEKQTTSTQKEKNFHLQERSYGSFSRSLRLPENIEENEIGASFQHGVLTITIPKSTDIKNRSRKISISGLSDPDTTKTTDLKD